MAPIKVQGWDVSLNHSGFVELTDGEMTNFWYITELAGSAARHPNGHRLKLPAFKDDNGKTDRQRRSMARLVWNEEFINKYLMASKPDYVGIEDYAVTAEYATHQLGEIGGCARLICWKSGLPFRLHDPRSVKMFATHNGQASKEDMEDSALDRWGVDFNKYNQPISKATASRPNPKQNHATSEDLADALAIAQLVWTEVQLRFGLIQLQDLHPKEIQVFNRVTKTYPVSLLSRDWIQNESANDPVGENGDGDGITIIRR